jgi:hypothetical protein
MGFCPLDPIFALALQFRRLSDNQSYIYSFQHFNAKAAPAARMGFCPLTPFPLRGFLICFYCNNFLQKGLKFTEKYCIMIL